MKEQIKKWLVPVIFVLTGAICGFLYYTFIGCKTGNCRITSNPYNSMVYMAVMGWLLWGIVKK
ncbi:MAG: hypothetical protein IKL51_06835 [Lachnospiraceae bacterium]|nr:hypothetical protein [Lachnospiraceae bacterium]